MSKKMQRQEESGIEGTTDKNILSDWVDLIGKQAEESAKARQRGKDILLEVDNTTTFSSKIQELQELMSRHNELVLIATQTRGVKTEEEAKQLRESLIELRTKINNFRS